MLVGQMEPNCCNCHAPISTAPAPCRFAMKPRAATRPVGKNCFILENLVAATMASATICAFRYGYGQEVAETAN